MAAAAGTRRRWLPWLAAGVGVLVLATLSMYFVNPFGTASPDPRARLLGYVTYRMASVSMAPTIERGEFVLVDSKAFAKDGPARGDIVVYLSARDGRPAVHRVAALPGERVEIRQGQLIVDGQAQPPPPGVVVPVGAGLDRDMGQLAVPADHYFVLGDNRDRAEDSRFTGTVPRNRHVGSVVGMVR